jgi:hypothetical protein
MGFGDNWIEWIIMTLMLNGVLGKKFYCRRGVRQGDPLSPLLFVRVAHFLQSVLSKAMNQGLNLQAYSLPLLP